MPKRLSVQRVTVPFTLILLSAFLARPLAAQELSANAIRELKALLEDKAARTPAQRKMDTSLLFAHRQSKGEAMVSGLHPFPLVAARANVDARGMVLVDIKADVTDALLQAIVAAGGEVLSSYPGYGAVRARIPIVRVEDIAALPEVRFVGPEEKFALNTGSVNSQGDVAHSAATTRSFFGVTGSGVKVGVISDSASLSSIAARQATGDLPPVVTIVQQGSGLDEGTAMLEIVHDLAPGAQLFFATAAISSASFASNILALRNTYGCDVIVDDVIYFNEGAFQDGPIAQAVNAVTASGALYFSAAGNSGNVNDGTSGTWEGDFVNSGTVIPAVAGTVYFGVNYPIHSFNGVSGAGSANSDSLTAPANSAISLQWSDPLAGSSNDYDLFRLDSGLTTVLDGSILFQTGTQDPLEIMGPGPAGSRIVIVLFSGVGRALRLNTHRGRLAIATARSVFGHNGGASTISVAAVNVATAGGFPFTGGPANPVETYSSDGPRRVFYNAFGAPITPGNLLFGTGGGQDLLKPDLTAADCGATAFPPGPFNPFCGTSAAAPHAAAIAALLKSTPNRPSAGQVQAAMFATALDIEAAGRDRDSGVGIVMANPAANLLVNIPAAAFYTVTPCRVLDTRDPAGPFGGPALTCGFERTFTFAGRCGIPSGAKAVSLNATVLSPGAGGNLRLFAAGAPAPTTSALNWSAGQTRGNNAVIPLNGSGQLTARCAPSGSTDLIIDANGYFQ